MLLLPSAMGWSSQSLPLSEQLHVSKLSSTHVPHTLSMSGADRTFTPLRAGSVVAMVTPMTAKNDIDYPKLTSLLEWHVEQGTDGAIILGTTGEASTISMVEREKIIKTAVATVKDKNFPIIIGTGAIDPSKVIEMNQQALDCGADAALVVTPYYVKPPQRALINHFTTIADAVPLPVILYNCPGRTACDMSPETIAKLSQHTNIVGCKDATGDPSRIIVERDLCGDKSLFWR